MQFPIVQDLKSKLMQFSILYGTYFFVCLYILSLNRREILAPRYINLISKLIISSFYVQLTQNTIVARNYLSSILFNQVPFSSNCLFFEMNFLLRDSYEKKLRFRRHISCLMEELKDSRVRLAMLEERFALEVRSREVSSNFSFCLLLENFKQVDWCKLNLHEKITKIVESTSSNNNKIIY